MLEQPIQAGGMSLVNMGALGIFCLFLMIILTSILFYFGKKYLNNLEAHNKEQSEMFKSQNETIIKVLSTIEKLVGNQVTIMETSLEYHGEHIVTAKSEKDKCYETVVSVQNSIKEGLKDKGAEIINQLSNITKAIDELKTTCGDTNIKVTAHTESIKRIREAQDKCATCAVKAKA